MHTKFILSAVVVVALASDSVRRISVPLPANPTTAAPPAATAAPTTTAPPTR